MKRSLTPRLRAIGTPLAIAALDRPGDDGRADDGVEGLREAAA